MSDFFLSSPCRRASSKCPGSKGTRGSRVVHFCCWLHLLTTRLVSAQSASSAHRRPNAHDECRNRFSQLLSVISSNARAFGPSNRVQYLACRIRCRVIADKPRLDAQHEAIRTSHIIFFHHHARVTTPSGVYFDRTNLVSKHSATFLQFFDMVFSDPQRAVRCIVTDMHLVASIAARPPGPQH